MPAELQDDDLTGDSGDEDEDEIPSGLDDDDESAFGDSSLGDDSIDADEVSSDMSSESEGEDLEERDGDEDAAEDDAFSLAEASDAEDLISLDAEMPVDLIEYDGSDASDPEDEWGGIGADQPAKKRKRPEEDAKKGKKKLRSLPTFASYEDYARMIEDGPEDNL